MLVTTYIKKITDSTTTLVKTLVFIFILKIKTSVEVKKDQENTSSQYAQSLPTFLTNLKLSVSNFPILPKHICEKVFRDIFKGPSSLTG